MNIQSLDGTKIAIIVVVIIAVALIIATIIGLGSPLVEKWIEDSSPTITPMVVFATVTSILANQVHPTVVPTATSLPFTDTSIPTATWTPRPTPMPAPTWTPMSSSPPPTMNNVILDILGKIIVEVVVFVITAIATYLFTRQRFKKKYEAAAKQYADALGKQISISARTNEEIVRQARSIVAMRDDLAKGLENLSGLLNSEISQLGTLMSYYQREPSTGILQETRIVIDVLKNKWPTKKTQIENEIRKVLIELGLQET